MRQLQHFSRHPSSSSSLRTKREASTGSNLFDAILNFVEVVLNSDQLRVLLEMAGEVVSAALGGDGEETREAVDSFFDQLDQTISSNK